MLFVHPFAEEMNKSRRMAALQARALALHGWTVLQIDLFGCGDSEGEFAEADWQRWLADVSQAAAWLREQTGLQPALWGLRAGCLLACGAAMTMQPAPDLLFWQSAIAGRQILQQFLRLGVTARLFGDSNTDRLSTDRLRERLAAGESVEIAGYRLSPDLARGLNAAELVPPAAPARVGWIEVAPTATGEPSPASRTTIAAWQAAGHRVEARTVAGPAFWQTQEIAECPELIDATLAAVANWRA